MLKSKLITKILSLTLVVCSIGNIGIAFASDYKSSVTKEFLEASDDTIVCYMEGIPIKKVR
mgnify:CR=1 FL=1